MYTLFFNTQPMNLSAQLGVAIVALIHLYIVWLEMFAWNTRGPKVFKSIPAELFPRTKALAGNQGLYNGFLAAGLIWSLCIGNVEWARNIASFFLICILVAGLYGAMTADKKILLVQSVPAASALVALWM